MGRSEWEGSGTPGVKYISSLGKTVKVDNAALNAAYTSSQGGSR
jgi:hypothetical protein